MKRLPWCCAVAFLACALLVGCGKSATNAAQDEALTALKNLRDRGVLTQEEYDAKVATLTGRDQALKALQSLRERGVLTQGEYEAKVAMLQGSTGPSGLGDSLGGGSGALDSGAGNELSGGAPARLAREPNAEARTPRATPRGAYRRQLAQGNSPLPDRGGGSEKRAGDSQSSDVAQEDGNSNSNPMRNLWSRVRAKTAAVGHSVHDLGSKMLNRAAHTPPPTSDDPQALQSYGQTLLNGNDPSEPNAGDTQGAPDSPPRQ